MWRLWSISVGSAFLSGELNVLITPEGAKTSTAAKGVATLGRKDDRQLKRAAIGQLALPGSNMALTAIQTAVKDFQSEPTPEPQPQAQPRRSSRTATQRVSQQGQLMRKHGRM